MDIYELISPIEQFFSAGGLILWPLLLVGVWLGYLLVMRNLMLRDLASARDLPALQDGSAALQHQHPASAARQTLLQRGELLLLEAHYPSLKAFYTELMRRQLILSRKTTLLNALIASAPLLGLLGTVNGMIATFDAMSDMALLTQTGGIARGISEALITTQMGLSIALPGLLAQRVLQRRTRLLQHHIEHLSLSCLRILQS